MSDSRQNLPLFKAKIPHGYKAWVFPILGFAAWWGYFLFHASDPIVSASPADVAASFWRLHRSGQFWPAVISSLSRMAIGFAIGSSLGLVVGTALGMSRRIDKAIGPTFHAVKQVSLFAWIPLIAMWFGLGEPAKIVVLGYAAFFPVLLNTYEGIRGVSREHLEVARTLEFSLPQIILRVVLPSALPSLFTGINLGLIYAWLATLGAEYLLTSGRGLGTLLVEGREHSEMDQILVGILAVGLIGAILNGLSAKLEARLLRWRGGSTGNF